VEHKNKKVSAISTRKQPVLRLSDSMPKPNLHVPGKGRLKPACLFWGKPVMQIFYGNHGRMEKKQKAKKE
jgi:hypothetical protein